MSCSPAIAMQIFAQSPSSAASNPSKTGADPLPSWIDADGIPMNSSSNKDIIKEFVEGPAQDIRVEDRIAVFDNDGTLWAERPLYFQFDYILDKVHNAGGREKSALTASQEESLSLGLGLKTTGREGQPIEDYRTEVSNYLRQSKLKYTQDGENLVPDFDGTLDDIPDFETSYLGLVYKPMVELVEYLQANGFSVFICSGGGIDFVRAFSEDSYGIPRQNVIGSSLVNYYNRIDKTVKRPIATDLGAGSFAGDDYGDDGRGGGYPTPPEALKPVVVNPFNDKEGKAIGIERYLGKQPIMAVGNSNGDFFMFDYTAPDETQNLVVLLNHDNGCTDTFDESCEYQYNDTVEEACADTDNDGSGNSDDPYCSVAQADQRSNWLKVSMTSDFNQIFFDSFAPPHHLAQ